ncbi:MAG: hypothetical protein QOJ74_1360, partial [Ilumatobacteraceae bacterium]|nr:hypothetical protein [Ilumatobacteraceae bacterium]
FDALTSAADHLEIDRWCTANESSTIDFITVDTPAVSVHGRTHDSIAVCGRVSRRGALTTELDQAFAVMRRVRDV